MSIKSFFNQSLVLYPKTGYDRYARMVVGSGTDYNVRFEAKEKTKVLENGEVVTILGIVYADGGLEININDKVTYNGVDYKVFSKKAEVDGAGNIHHLKLELIKWAET